MRTYLVLPVGVCDTRSSLPVLGFSSYRHGTSNLAPRPPIAVSVKSGTARHERDDKNTAKALLTLQTA